MKSLLMLTSVRGLRHSKTLIVSLKFYIAKQLQQKSNPFWKANLRTTPQKMLEGLLLTTTIILLLKL